MLARLAHLAHLNQINLSNIIDNKNNTMVTYLVEQKPIVEKK